MLGLLAGARAMVNRVYGGEAWWVEGSRTRVDCLYRQETGARTTRFVIAVEGEAAADGEEQRETAGAERTKGDEGRGWGERVAAAAAATVGAVASGLSSVWRRWTGKRAREGGEEDAEEREKRRRTGDG